MLEKHLPSLCSDVEQKPLTKDKYSIWQGLCMHPLLLRPQQCYVLEEQSGNTDCLQQVCSDSNYLRAGPIFETILSVSNLLKAWTFYPHMMKRDLKASGLYCTCCLHFASYTDLNNACTVTRCFGIKCCPAQQWLT